MDTIDRLPPTGAAGPAFQGGRAAKGQHFVLHTASLCLLGSDPIT